MLWEDDKVEKPQTSSETVDLAFSMQCRQLPVDHLHPLSQALAQVLPQMRDNRIAVHEIHIAGSQNGWERPDPSQGQHLMPSRRTRMTLRVPADHAVEVANKLQGITLDIDGCELTLGKAKAKPLSSHDTLYARHVVMLDDEWDDENLFLQRMAEELDRQDIQIRKALCGKGSHIATPNGPLHTRSLMIADLSPSDSLRLQQQGLGEHQHLGCGIFLPMKGIQAVPSPGDD
ncbi:type I-MYXAN CRISPR-associated protein Cas6/Cmx6 [Thiolapillus brandeum]|uniref:CRISPR-associated protein, Cas6-related protein n=1 Tax=Thiolapillus brandeum TaxID=1076588 RepID=A0A7U6GKU5_9GAMM|nr:type I-MYXAN CRISPR-associated protein Cas6/Cmx6 [Thiolapillus brandeum]BAO45374.1 CRISPR-associated protein, Cas6-related protein [Thiolapillus brandeum]